MRRPLATATGTHNGQPGRGLPVFVGGPAWLAARRAGALLLGGALLLTAGPAFSAAPAFDTASLNELVELARAGAPQLALARLDAGQPPPGQDPATWSVWERERLQILASQGHYAALVERVDALPVQSDADLQRFAHALKAEAQLQLDQADAARATLRDLLWSAAGVQPAEWSRWRQMVIRSYVIEDRGEDAQLALVRYRQDFGNTDASMRWLNAQILLQNGRADTVDESLKADTSAQGRFLRYSARLTLYPQQAAEVAEAAAALASQNARPALQGAVWGLAAQAAAAAGQTQKHIQYLERALSLPLERQLIHGVTSYSADQLWDAYIEAGKRIGNDEQKLLGNDEDWYFPAVESVDKDPLRARILFAVLAEFGSGRERRAVAHEYLAGLLDDLPDGKQLTRRLYLESERYADARALPSVIRYRLIDDALESANLDLASRLMAGLTEPPAGSDRFEWDLRRARVAVYTGDTEGGVSLLQQLLDSGEQDWREPRVDRLVQVIFDLQTVQKHTEALTLFNGLLDKPLAARQRRELLFWMADSLQGLQRYDEAAYLYLRSATLIDPTAMDPWAQTARYRAARSLVDAGLLDDAQQIYGLLLRATGDASRKSVLQNELQGLRLLRGVRRHDKDA